MTETPFELVRTRIIPSLHVELQEYRHRRTGARHVHLAADDNQNVFLVAFLTVPQDSTGVAHILEHTALCGSRRYPVRDPFFMMTRRSLNTFMNAFTGSDWTAYPFASQNRKDFENLLEVYLDAAFFPLLEELDFTQEGHRVEPADPNDSGSPLVYKGVVYNEMKGAMSSPIDTLAHELQARLFPTTTYHHNSGGDPAHIPELGYEQLKAFHARHYHPSNAVFMTYGDISAAEHQARFEERALRHFQVQVLDFAVPDERRYPAPQSFEAPYALDGDEDPRDKTHVVLGWLLGKNTDPQTVLEAKILADTLLDNSSSPLRRALETSRLGSAPSPLCGFDDSTRETTFVCGLEGSNPEHAAAVEELALGVIAEVAERGVPQETLESVLHQLELGQREVTGDGFPYGLRLLLEALTPAIHGGDPAAALDLDSVLDSLRDQIKDPEFIKKLARRHLLDNPHRVRLTLVPDVGLSTEKAEAERARLEAFAASLSPSDREIIVKKTRELEARQARQDDPELLPRVTLEDVAAELRIPEGEPRPVGELPVTWYDRGTNGMVYQQLVLDLPDLDEELLDLLPLFCLCVSEVGSAGRDYLETQALQARVTGGLGARCPVRGAVDDVQQTRGLVVIAGKALARNQAALTQLLFDTFAGARFDELPRLRELIAQTRAQREATVTDHGHVLAMTAACAGLSPTAALAQRWDGLAGLKQLKYLDDALDDETTLAAFAARLEHIRDRLLAAPRQLLVVSEGEQQAAIAEALADCWQGQAAPAVQNRGFAPEPVNAIVRQGWAVGTQVSFCAKAYPTVAPDHPDAPALQVLGELLRNGYLHRAIREQGGAYGAGAGYHGDSGAFRFFSYRDPRLEETLADFDRALDWLHDAGHSPRILEEAILGAIGTIDRPGSPAGEAITAFFGSLFGRTPGQRRTYRSRVLAVTWDDLRRVAASYLAPERASVAVVSDAGTLRRQGNLEVLAL